MSTEFPAVPLAHMHHENGRVLLIKRLCELARAREIVALIDGAQTFAQMPVGFCDLGCDFVVNVYTLESELDTLVAALRDRVRRG